MIQRGLFYSPSEYSVEEIKERLKKKQYMEPTPKSSLRIGDNVIIVSYDKDDSELDCGYYYVGKKAVVDAFDEKSTIPQLLDLDDEALFIKNFEVIRI